MNIARGAAIGGMGLPASSSFRQPELALSKQAQTS